MDSQLAARGAGEQFERDSDTFAKRCCTCEQRKSRSEFTKHPGHSDGLRSDCKACQAEYRRRTYVSRRQWSDRKAVADPRAPKVPIYNRVCNRCDERYRGRGRLLCDACFKYASAQGGNDVVTNGTFRRGGGGAS